MPALAQVANTVGVQSTSTYLVHLQRSRDDSWGLAWNYEDGVSPRRLLVSGVSPCSPAGRVGSLQRGDELLSANGFVEHEDMLRELDEALEVKFLFRSAAESPTALTVCHGTVRPVDSNVAATAASRRQASSEPVFIKARVKNTFLHFSDSGEAEGAKSDDAPRFSKTDPLPKSKVIQYRSSYVRGCLAGLDMPHAALALETPANAGNRSARSNSSTDGTTSQERVSNGIPSYPSTDWDYPTYHPAPIQRPLYALQPVQIVQAGAWPAPGFGVAPDGQHGTQAAPPLVVPLRPLPDLGTSSSEEVDKTHTGRTDITSSCDEVRKKTQSDPSDNSEAARSEAGPPPKSMANFWEVEKWTKPDDPQSSMDESTTYCSTLSSNQKKQRRGGKRMNRPCHLRAKQERSSNSSPDPDDPGDAQRRSLYPSLTKEELEQANLNSQPPALTSSMMRDKILSFQEEAMSEMMSQSGKVLPVGSEQRQVDVAAGKSGTRTTNKSPENASSAVADASSLLASAEDLGTPCSDLLGKRALLKGLVRMPEFNGEWGTVTGYDEDTQRYKVSVQSSSGTPLVAKLRRQNLFIPTTVAIELAEQENSVPPVADLGADTPLYVSNVEKMPPATTPLTEASEARHEKKALKATLRRAALRRHARDASRQQAGLEGQTSSQTINSAISTNATEVTNVHHPPVSNVSSHIRRRPSCPASSRQQVSSAVPRAKSARPLRREPSCSVSFTRETTGGSLDCSDRWQPDCSARSEKDPKVTSKSAKESGEKTSHPITASNIVETTHGEPSCVDADASQRKPCDSSTSSTCSTPTPTCSSDSANDGTSNQVVATTTCSEESPPPSTNQKVDAAKGGNLVLAPSSQNAVDCSVPASAPGSSDVLTSPDASENGDYEMPKKWQRHRTAREVQVLQTKSENGPASADCSGLCSGTAGTSATEAEVGAVLTCQGARTAIAVRDSGADATKWRPTLRLRK